MHRGKLERYLAVLILFGTVPPAGGCSKKASQRLLPAGSPMAPYIRFEYAVYMMPVSQKSADTVLKKALAEELPTTKLVGVLPDEPHEMSVTARKEMHVQKNYAPPSDAQLSYSAKGLTDDQKRALHSSREALILDFGHAKNEVWTGLRSADQLIEKIGRGTGGLIWDEETREVYSPDEWHKERIVGWTGTEPDMAKEIVVHLYENGEFVRAISLGMKKAGLPDVVVEELPESSSGQVGILIDLFAQSLVEGRENKSSGNFKLSLRAIQNAQLRDPQLKSLGASGTGVACLAVKDAKPEEGDPKNRLVELSFDRYVGKDQLARQDAAISWFFGREDALTQVEHTDELLEESRKEKSKLTNLHRDFEAGLRPGEYILVKAPFDTPDDGHEWMWVEVRSWNGGSIKGVLENEPDNVPGLQAGQIVEVRESDLFDYIRRYPDGHSEGNTTGALMHERNQGRHAVATTGQPPACEE